MKHTASAAVESVWQTWESEWIAVAWQGHIASTPHKLSLQLTTTKTWRNTMTSSFITLNTEPDTACLLKIFKTYNGLINLF